VQLGSQSGGRDRDAELGAGQRADGDRLTGQPHHGVSQRGGAPQDHPQQDVGRMVAEVTEVQRRPQPHEEQRPEESLRDPEQLPRQPSGLADARHRDAEGEPGQHDRHVRAGGQRGQREEDDEADPQLQSEGAFLGHLVDPFAHTIPLALTQDDEQHDCAGDDREGAEGRARGVSRVDRER
jgi:hypothetical protein